MFKRFVCLLGVLSAVFIFAGAEPVHAAAYTWDGGGSTNNWSDCLNWSTNVCPVGADTVTFDATSTKNASIDASWGGSITGITIASGYSGTVSVDRSLAVSGAFSIAAGAFNGTSQSIDFNGSVTISGGTFTASSGSMTMAGGFTHTAGGTFAHNNGSITMDGSTAFTWNVAVTEELYNLTINNTSTSAITVASGDTLNVNNTLTFTDGSIATGTIAGKGATIVVDAGWGTGSNSSGTLLVNGGGAQTVTIAPQSNASFEAFDQLTLNNALASITGTGGAGAIGLDKITLTAGTLNVTGYTLIANETMTINGGTLTLGTTGTSTIGSTFNLSAGIFNGGSATVDFNGTVTISGGTFNASSGLQTMDSNFTHTAGGTFNHGNGSITIDGSTAVTWDVSTTENLYNLTINNTSTSAMTVASGDTLNVNNNATFTDGGIITGTIAVKGPAVSIGTNFGFSAFSNGTLTINGSGAQTVTMAVLAGAGFEPFDQIILNNAAATFGGTGAAGTLAFDKVTVTAGVFDMTGYTFSANEAVVVNGGTMTMGTSGTNTFSGTFSLSSGTFNGGSGNVNDFNSTITISGGTFNASSATTTAAGDYTHSAGGVFNHNNGLFTIDGSSGSTIDIGTTETFYDLTINNSATTALTLTSGTTLNVNNALTLTDGGWLSGTIAAKGPTTTIGAGFGFATIAAGTLTINGVGVQSVTMAALAAGFEPVDQLTINNASATLTGTGASGVLAFDKVTVTAGLFDATGYTVSINEPVIINGGTMTMGNSGTNTFNGTFAISSGTFNGSAATLDFNSTVTVSGGIMNFSSTVTSLAGTYTHTAGGTVNYNGTTLTIDGGSGSTWDVSTNETVPALTVAKTGSATWTIATGDTMIVTGTTLLTDGELSTGAISARGDVTVSSTWDGGAGTSVLSLDGSGVVVMTHTNGGNNTEPANTLIVNNANATVNMPATGASFVWGLDIRAGVVNVNGGDLTVGSTYTQSGGTFNGGAGSVTTSTTYTLSGGTFNAPSGTLNLVDDFTHTAGGTFNHNNGLVKTINAVDLTFDFNVSETFYNFESSKTTNWQTIITSGDSLIVLNTATLTDGRIMTGTLEIKNTLSIASTYDYGNASLTFSGTVDQTFTLPSGQSASWDMPALTVNKASGTLTFGSDVTLDCGGTSCNLVLQQGVLSLNGFGLRVNDFSISNGTFISGASTVDIDDDLTITGGTFNATTGTTIIGGDFTHTAGGVFNHNNGTVEFDTSNDQTINVNVNETFYTVRISKNGFQQTITAGDTITVLGNLLLTDGRFGTGTIDMQGAATTIASTYDPSDVTLKFTGTAAQTLDLTGAAAVFDGPVTIDKPSGEVALLSALTMDTSSRTLTLQSGTLNRNGFALTVHHYTQTGGTFSSSAGNVDVNGTFTLSGGTFSASSGTTFFGGAYTHTAGGTFDHNNGRVEFDTAVDITADVIGSETFYDLAITKAGNLVTLGAGDTLIATGDLYLTDGRFGGGTIEARGNVTVASTFDIGNAAYTFTGSAVQTFTLGVAANIDGDVTVNKSGGSVVQVGTLTLNAASQDLTIVSGTYDLNGSNLTVNGSSGTLVVQNGGVLQLQGGEVVTLNVSNPTFQAGSLARYTGTVGPYTLKNWTYRSITVDGGAASVFALPGALSLPADLTITSGIVSLGGNALTVSGTFSNDGTLRLRGNETVTLTNDADSGTVEYVGDGDAAADAYVLQNWPYYHLTLAFVDALDSASAGGTPLDINGSFTLSAGTFTAPATMTVAGNFAHSGGVFTHNNGTVVLDGLNQTVSGTTTFNHFTKSVSSAATLTLPATATQTFVGTMTLTGASGQRLSLRSSTPGVQALIDPQGTRTVSYLDVQDNNNANATMIVCSTGCVEGTNVTNWSFTTPGITVGAISGDTTEAGGTATFTVVLESEPTADVTIGVSSSDVTEGTVDPASLTFTSLNWDTPQTVTVTGTDDFVIDGSVVFSIVLEPAVSADLGYNGLDAADVSVTNGDNDVAGVVVTESAASTDVTEGGATDTYTLVLTAEPTEDVTITITADALITTDLSEVVFTALNWSTPQTVTVSAVDDDIASGALTPSISHTTDSLDGDFSGLVVADVVVNRADDDSAGITVGAISGDTTEAGGTATFTVVLTSEPTANVTIDVSSSDTTEGTVLPATLTFTALDWDTPQTVTATGVDDDLVDGSVPYTILLDASVSVDPNYSGINPTDVDVNNTDDDSAGVLVTSSGGLTEVSEAGATDTYTIVLTAEPTADVVVSVSPESPVETDLSEITFTSGNWSVAQTITVSAEDDFIAQGTHVHPIVHGTSSLDLVFDGLVVSDVNVSVLDNDTAAITVGAISGDTTEVGGTATFTVVLTSEPTADVTIDVSSSDTTEGTVLPATLTFTALNWSTPQTVTATGVNDAVDDGDVAYTLVLAPSVSDDTSYDAINPADVAAVNDDDDTVGITLVESDGETIVTEGGASDAYTVVLNSEPTANVNVFFIGDGDVTTSTAQMIFTSLNWSTPQALVVSAVDDSAVEDTEMHSILHVVTSADPLYGDVDLDGVPVTVIDDDEEEAEEEESGGSSGRGGSPVGSNRPTIDIRRPADGTTYALGSLGVSWTWTGTIPSVNVYLSWDSGTTWALQRYFITNTGQTTIVLDRESTTARVRVEGTDFIRSLTNDQTGTFSVSADASPIVNEADSVNQGGLTEEEQIAAIAARVAALPSVMTLHGLVKLADDGNPETHNDTTVYYVGADGYRHPFPNSHVFGSWFCVAPELVSSLGTVLADQVTEVTPSQLASVPLGPNVTYRPGYKMVKFITDPRVYAVDADGSLRWVLSETDAQTIYGEEWRFEIYDIADVFYRNYRFGVPLTDLTWDPEVVRRQVRYPSDVMKIPGYLVELAAETDLCPTM